MVDAGDKALFVRPVLAARRTPAVGGVGARVEAKPGRVETLGDERARVDDQGGGHCQRADAASARAERLDRPGAHELRLRVVGQRQGTDGGARAGACAQRVQQHGQRLVACHAQEEAARLGREAGLVDACGQLEDIARLRLRRLQRELLAEGRGVQIGQRPFGLSVDHIKRGVDLQREGCALGAGAGVVMHGDGDGEGLTRLHKGRRDIQRQRAGRQHRVGVGARLAGRHLYRRPIALRRRRRRGRRVRHLGRGAGSRPLRPPLPLGMGRRGQQQRQDQGEVQQEQRRGGSLSAHMSELLFSRC